MTTEPPARARTARALAREQVTSEILAAARTRLTQAGPGELSLRAVARDVGMVSSAVYRYYASRDELLTALLVVAYNELGAAAEEADAAVTDRGDSWSRWFSVMRAVRAWALSHPGDYALLYGSPVPGYAAPQVTVEPAGRVIITILRIVTEGVHDGAITPPPPLPDAPTMHAVAGAAEFVRQRGLTRRDFPVELVVRTLMAWTSVFGTISFELFGHLVGSVTDTDAYFDLVVARTAHDLGFPPPER